MRNPGDNQIAQVLTKLAAFAAKNPDLAAKAYAVTADKVRSASRAPENVTNAGRLAALAARLDRLSGESLSLGVGDIRAATQADVVQADLDRGTSVLQNDFDEYVMNIMEASAREGGDELARWAAFESIREANRMDRSLPVRITPISAKDKTIYGKLVTVQAVQTNAPTQPAYVTDVSSTKPFPDESLCVWWEGENWETQAITIHVGRVERIGGSGFPSATANGLNAIYFPYGKLQFGARGYPQDIVTMDVGRGLKFTVAASYVYFWVGMDPMLNTAGAATDGGGAAGTPGQMRLGASMGFFAAPSQAPVTRTIFITQLATGGANKVNVIVPVLAQELLSVQWSDTAGTVTLDFKDVPGNIIYKLTITNGVQAGQVAPIPIANDVYSIDVTNAGGSTANFRLVFKLAL